MSIQVDFERLCFLHSLCEQISCPNIALLFEVASAHSQREHSLPQNVAVLLTNVFAAYEEYESILLLQVSDVNSDIPMRKAVRKKIKTFSDLDAQCASVAIKEAERTSAGHA